MRLLMWFQGGNLAMVPLVANRFLEMMSETAVAWMLLEAAVIADAKLAKLDAEDADHAFYSGKIAAAIYYARASCRAWSTRRSSSPTRIGPRSTSPRRRSRRSDRGA